MSGFRIWMNAPPHRRFRTFVLLDNLESQLNVESCSTSVALSMVNMRAECSKEGFFFKCHFPANKSPDHNFNTVFVQCGRSARPNGPMQWWTSIIGRREVLIISNVMKSHLYNKSPSWTRCRLLTHAWRLIVKNLQLQLSMSLLYARQTCVCRQFRIACMTTERQ